jgi:hypothetical protein
MTQLLDDDVGKVEEIESNLIDLKAFVIEGHASAIGRASKKLLAARRGDGRSGEDARPPAAGRKVRMGIDNRCMELMVRGS